MRFLLPILIVLAASCGDTEATAPLDDTTDFVCDAGPLTGAATTGSALQKHGIFGVNYTVSNAHGDVELELLDSTGHRLYTLAVTTTPESLIEANAALILHDASDAEVLREESNVRFIPGLGSQIQTTREVDGSRIHIWNLLTTDRSVGALEVGVESTAAGATKTPQGTFSMHRAYDPQTQTFSSDDELNAWATSVGAEAPISGQLNALKAAVFADSTWRSYALAHLATCTTGVQTKPADLAGLDTPEIDDDSTTVRNALSCAEEDKIARDQAFISEKLDRLADIAGGLGDGTIKGLIIANADKFGVKGTFNVPGIGQVTVTPGDIAAIASFAQALGKAGATGVLLGNPAGILFAGIGAAAYIGARVNDAFGADIMRAMREKDPPGETEAERFSQRAYEKQKGTTSLDPHLRTYDGRGYSFMAEGDFILTRSLDRSFAVHVRQKRAASRCSDVSYNWGVAMQIGTQRISAYADDPVDSVRIDGELYEIKDQGSINLRAGGLISVDKYGVFSIVSVAADVVTFERKSGVWLNITVAPAPFRRGGLEGLLGNLNDDRDDDLQFPNGVIGQNVAWDTLYQEFRDAWLVADADSLLDYGEGETTQDYFDANMPERPYMVEDIPAAEVAQARQTCVDQGVADISLDNCTLDVYCSQDDDAARVHAELTPPDDVVEVDRPIFLDGWTAQGNPANGNWEVEPSARAVTQTQNGDPTFFVSPQNFINKTIRGRFSNSDNDDDYIGFVIGFEGPFTDDGDDPDDYKTLLFQWKQGDQSPALAGFTLAKLNGIQADYQPGFWANTDSPEYDVLGTDYGIGKAWSNGIEHEFELVYETGRIQIAVDGRRIFDLTAQQAGLTQFPEGRFGFYNYSQANVTYSNFSVSDTTPELGVKAFSITDFRGKQQDFELKQDAAIDSSSLALTTGGGNETGAAWHRSKVPISQGFTTDFTFRIRNQAPDAAQGLAFVIQNNDSALLAEGSTTGLGYTSINGSAAIEFDMLPDGENLGPHVALHSFFESRNSDDASAQLGAADSDVFADQQMHRARIEYRNKVITVYVDDLGAPLLTQAIDLDLLGLDGGHGHIGFTAHSENDAVHEIRTWSYTAL